MKQCMLKNIVFFLGDKVVNGDQKADGSGGEEELDEEPTTPYYDKTKSFFDNISCEASDRAKGLVINLAII